MPIERLSPAMTRALRAIADGDTRIDYIRHRRQWVTISGNVVGDTTLRALERRGYVAPVGRPGVERMRSRRLTPAATAYLKRTD